MSAAEGHKQRVRFALAIPADVYLAYYVGAARDVVAQCLDGRNVRFPANVLRQFVTREGIQGVFEIEFDEHNKFVGILRVEK